MNDLACPYCGSTDKKKKGLMSDSKRQRFKCVDCGKRYNEATAVQPDIDNKNESTNTSKDDRDNPSFPQQSYQDRLDELGLKETDIKSVKFWQTMNGENRFSIVSKDNQLEIDSEEFYNKLKVELTKEITPIKLNKKSIDIPRGFFIWSSDKHVGAYTPEKSIYPNEYNEQVFRQRMFSILDELLYKASIFGRFDKVVFADLGDPLDGYNGQTARKHHFLPQNMDNEEQFDVYLRVHKDFFDTLVSMDVCNEIQFFAVSEDNHSSSFGYCANRALQTYLNARYPTIETKVTKKFIDHFVYGDHTFMMCHGKDSEDLKFGFPIALNDRAENLITDYIEAKRLRGYKHFIKGDLHQSAEQYGKRFRYKNVLSLYGASKYIQNNYGNSMAGLTYEIIDKYEPRVNSMNLIF